MDLDPELINITLQLILIVILTFIHAFFASAETAIISLNQNKIKLLKEEGYKKAKLLSNLIDEPTDFLTTIQVGITFAGFFSSALATTGISEQFALIIVTIILCYFTLVFGILFPRRIALKKPETIAMFSVKPIKYISKISIPFISLLSASTNILSRLICLDKYDSDEKISKKEIKSFVEVGQEHEVINETEKK